VRRLVLPLALVAATAALAGCGGVQQAVDPVAAAATNSKDAGSAKLALALEVTAGGETHQVTADGAFARGAARLAFDLSGIEPRLGELEVRYLEEAGKPVTYVKLPALVSQLAGGKTWARLDLAQAGKTLGLDLSSFAQNPVDALGLLTASGGIERVGSETLDGVEATHYKGTVDLDRVEGVPAPALERMKAAGAQTLLPVDVWLGEDGLVRRVKLHEPFGSGADSGSADVRIDFRDYGSDVYVTAPPAADVFDATALAALAGGTKTTR
jgi:hypothetical protein